MPSKAKPQSNNKPAVSSDDKLKREIAAVAAQETDLNPALKKKKPINYKKILKLYVVPIIALVIFIGMLFVLIIPNLSGAFSTLDKASELNGEYDTQNAAREELQNLALRTNETKADLDLVNQLAPTGVTEVVNFQRRITDLATKNNLKVIESKTGEQVLVVDETVAVLGLVEIPSTFSLQGHLQDAKDFIEQIDNLYDFVLISEMDLNATARTAQDDPLKNINDENWTLTITLSKYQFQVPDEINKLADAYLKVPPTVDVDKDTLSFVRGKYQSTQSSDTTSQTGN